MTAAPAPRDFITRLMDGYLSTQMLYVTARLGLVDLLIDGPRTSADLAAAVNAAPAPLHRLLRGLVMEGLLSEETNGSFSLTDAARLLRADGPGSIRGAVLARGALYYRAAGGLLDTIRGGGPAFRHVYGVELFEHLDSSPEDAALFQQSMLARSHKEAEAVATTYDFTPFEHIVDIGGGYGVTLTAILQAHPHARGTLFDRPDVVADARARLAADGMAERATVVGGDFFESVPTGGDVYVLSRVLHDWDDEDAVRILKSVRSAMTEQSGVGVASSSSKRSSANACRTIPPRSAWISTCSSSPAARNARPPSSRDCCARRAFASLASSRRPARPVFVSSKRPPRRSQGGRRRVRSYMFM